MWSTLASVRDGVQKTAFEGLAKVSTVLGEEEASDDGGEVAEGDAEVYRTLLETLQFEQLKLSNEYAAVVKEQAELRLQYDALVAKHGVDDEIHNLDPSPQASKAAPANSGKPGCKGSSPS